MCVYEARLRRISEVTARDGLCQKDDQIGVCRFQRMYDNMIVMSRISCGNLTAKHIIRSEATYNIEHS